MGRRTRHVAAVVLALLAVVALGSTPTGRDDRAAHRAAPGSRSVLGATVHRAATPGATTPPVGATSSTTAISNAGPSVTGPVVVPKRRPAKVYWWEITRTVTAAPPSDGASVVTAPQPSSTPGSGSSPTVPTAGQPITVTWPGWEVQMLGGVNAQRAAVGAAPLALCYALNRAAETESDDQAGMERMTHIGSDGSGLGERADGHGYLNWTLLAENIGEGYPDAESVMAAWVDSPDHLENMRYPQLTDVGFAESTSSTGVTYWTQDFGTGGTC